MAACPRVSPGLLVPYSCSSGFWARPCGFTKLSAVSSPAHLSSSSMASLASTISAALSKANIKTVDEFASAVELAPGFVANLLRNEGVQAQAQRLHSEMSTMTDTVVLDVATQTALTGDVVDVSTAEAMVEEALCMVAEAEEGERAAQKCAREWLDRAELGTALLRKAEERTDWAQRERRAAQALATAEQAARHMAEQLLAAEAALADAAVESALN